jgi:hypothetical protein
MSFEISIFKTLRESYPSWDALKTYLTSEEGGKFTARDCENTPFAIIRYKRGESILGENGHWLRSVVWNKETNLPVCVSPRKANAGMPPVGTPLHIEEFYDGVMVNVFWILGADGAVSEEHITTRSQYGAGGTFYSQRTFKELFSEGERRTVWQAKNIPTEEFPATFMSYVLQHPEHRVVASVSSPKLIMVECGKVAADGTVIYYDGALQRSEPFFNTMPPTTFASEKEMNEHIRTESIRRGWRWQGFIFRDTAGNRWRIRSPTYTYLRKLRGNEAKPLDRFLRLRSTSGVTEYLKHYGEERQVFWEFESTLRQRTKDIYEAYVSVHKSHEKKLADLPQPDKTVVFKLHSHFLANLRPQSKSIRMQDVIDLVNTLPLWEQALLFKVPKEQLPPLPASPKQEQTAPEPPAM